MKRFIAILLTLALALSLCGCGSVEIGPLTFNFGDRNNAGEAPYWTDSTGAVIAPPAEEIAPEFTFEEFSVVPLGSFMGDITPRGYHPSNSPENPALYLFFVFEYTEYHGSYGANEINYVPEVIIQDTTYYALEADKHEGHFINSIDRYFGYEYAAPARALQPGESAQMIVCFEITEEARAALHAGYSPIYCVQGTFIECPGSSDIMFAEETFCVAPDPDLALSEAQLLWSLDMSFYLINYIMQSTEVYGDTGVFDPYPATIIHEMFSNGKAFSPAMTPDLAGYFATEYAGMQGIVPEPALAMYGDEATSLFFEYRDYCFIIADLAMSSGNTDELFYHCELAISLYYELLAWLGMTPYEVVIYEV